MYQSSEPNWMFTAFAVATVVLAALLFRGGRWKSMLGFVGVLGILIGCGLLYLRAGRSAPRIELFDQDLLVADHARELSSPPIVEIDGVVDLPSRPEEFDDLPPTVPVPVRVVSEVLRNQRRAARMNDAEVQSSPDGSVLETYPDGMQVRQSPSDDREILPPGSPFEVLTNRRLASSLPDAFIQTSSDGTRLETYPDGMQVRQTPDSERTLLAPARPAEILQRQRLAASLPDAVVQHSPDGSRLETYADGMQIRETPDQERTVLREADRPLSGAFFHANSPMNWQPTPQRFGAVVLLPIILVAVLLLGRVFWKSGGHVGWGVVIAGGILVALFGATLVSHRPVQPEPPVRVDHRNSVSPRQSELDGDLWTSMPPVEMPPVPALPIAPLAFHAPESIELMWNKLTQPRIKLENSPLTSEARVTNRELADAAKMILSVTAPAADPFTQGWLTQAARAIAGNARTPAAEASNAAQALAGYNGAPARLRSGGLQAEAISLPAQQRGPAERLDPELATKLRKGYHQAAEASDPSERPQWLREPARLVGELKTYAVSAGPYVTIEECHRQLEQEIRRVLERHLAELTTDAQGVEAVIPPLESLGLRMNTIVREYCRDEFVEQSESPSVGPMLNAHVLLQFTPSQDAMLLGRWQGYARQEGIRTTALLAGLTVGAMGFVYGLLKVDTWTRGYYTKRLFLGAAAAIIGVVALLAKFG